jgi:hypothetical protein
VLAVADGRLDEIIALETLSRFDESGDQSRAAINDVEALRKRGELGAGEPRLPPTRDKIIALKRGSCLNTAPRDT